MKSLSILALLVAFASTTYAQACIPIQETWCEAIFYCWVEIFGDSIDCEFDVYDSYCKTIISDPGANVGDSLGSILQYTVEVAQLTEVAATNRISAQWWYAGHLYGRGASPYTTGTFTVGLTGGAWIRAGFQCVL